MTYDPDRFVAGLMQTMRSFDEDAFDVYFGVVADVSNGGADVEVKRQAIAGSEEDSGTGMVAKARLLGATLAVDDLVLVMRDGTDHYVLGHIGGDAPDTALTTVLQRGFDVKTGDGAPVDASNNSTTTYASLFSEPWSLPTVGLWRAELHIVGIFKNDTATRGTTMRLSAPGASGGTTITAPTAAAPHPVIETGGVSGLSGDITIGAEYRASGGGITTPQRWSYIAIARRES